MSTSNNDELFTTNFVLVSVVWMLVFAGYYLLMAILPVYVVKQLGGQEASVGLVIGVPTISTVLLLPVFGRQADRHGRKIILLLGLLGLSISGPLYILASTLHLLLILRLFFGVVWGAAVAALMALIADVSPVERRGEAMGYVNITANIALAIGPAIGIAMIKSYDFSIVFMIFTGLAILALATSLAIRETHRKPQDSSSVVAQSPTPKPRSLQKILFAPMIMMTVTLSYGTLLSFLPIYAIGHGVDNPGLFFTVLSIFLIISRAATGRLSDKVGRRAVILPGMGVIVFSLLILSMSASLPAILLVAALYGAGFGATHSALMALAADRSDEASRGAAMSYLAASVELGIGVGSIVLGLIVQFVGFSGMYVTASLIVLTGLTVFFVLERGSKPVVDSGDTRVVISE